MALPSSGALSMRDIADELGINPDTSLSLAGMSGTAGFSDPDSISEFYGYSNGLPSISLDYGQYSSSQACSFGATGTKYHDGAGSFPAINDKLYTDSAGTSPATAGYYSNTTSWVRVFGTAGNIISSGTC